MEHSGEGKYLAVIISEVKTSARELYPLTKNFEMGLLPIGTKKLIAYQLEALMPLQSIAKIVIVNGQEDNAVRTFVELQFLAQHRDYPHAVEFFSVEDLSNTFEPFKELLNATKEQYEGFLLIHGDTVCGVPLAELVRFHEEKKSDLSLLMKAKREAVEGEKKLPEGEIETELDNILLGQNGEVLFMDMADEIQNNGVKIDPSIYGQVKKASFRRALDSKVYLMSNRLCRIVLELSTEEIYQIKPWLIQELVGHQTNIKLLNITGEYREQDLTPLKIFAKFYEQEVFIKRISNKKTYQQINFDSLIRGTKQKEVLLPNSYSEKTEFKTGPNYLVADNVSIGNGAKIRRSVIGANCRIGKNVELFNSILLEGVEIKDNCKVTDSVLGSGTVVGESAQLKGTYSEGGCRVADSLKIEGDNLIRTQ